MTYPGQMAQAQANHDQYKQEHSNYFEYQHQQPGLIPYNQQPNFPPYRQQPDQPPYFMPPPNNAYGTPPPGATDPITAQYGPCASGGIHEIRYHYKTRDLLLAFLIFPIYCMRTKDVVCKKCKKVLGSI